MGSIMFAIGIGCLGLWLGSLIERIVSFTKVRREMSNVIDKVDGTPGN